LLPNKIELYQIAEFMRREYAEQLLATRRNNSAVIPDNINTYDLSINSAWRNPERNETVGGAHNSDHQHGRALDLASIFCNNKSKRKTLGRTARVALQLAVFHAGGEFLRQLVALNEVADCQSVEVLLEKNTTLLCRYKVRNDGTVYIHPQDTTAFLEAKADIATHTHIGWKSATPNKPLTLPRPKPYTALPDQPLTYRNLIVIGHEADATPAAEQLPLLQLAATIKAELEGIDPYVPTEIREVANPLRSSEYLNAAREPRYRLRYFFCLAHAEKGGLTLAHYPNDGSIPYQRPEAETGTQIHNQAILDQLELLATDFFPQEVVDGIEADDADDDTDVSEDDSEYVPNLTIGDDFLTQFRTHQVRVSNLHSLLDYSQAHVRDTFQEAIGVFLLGFNASSTPDTTEGNFYQEFANLVNKRIYGFIQEDAFLEKQADGTWSPTTIRRGDVVPDGMPIIPRPASDVIGVLQHNIINNPEINDPIIHILKLMSVPYNPIT
jgi:hypothetical protein